MKRVFCSFLLPLVTYHMAGDTVSKYLGPPLQLSRTTAAAASAARNPVPPFFIVQRMQRFCLVPFHSSRVDVFHNIFAPKILVA